MKQSSCLKTTNTQESTVFYSNKRTLKNDWRVQAASLGRSEEPRRSARIECFHFLWFIVLRSPLWLKHLILITLHMPKTINQRILFAPRLRN